MLCLTPSCQLLLYRGEGKQLGGGGGGKNTPGELEAGGGGGAAKGEPPPGFMVVTAPRIGPPLLTESLLLPPGLTGKRGIFGPTRSETGARGGGRVCLSPSLVRAQGDAAHPPN